MQGHKKFTRSVTHQDYKGNNAVSADMADCPPWCWTDEEVNHAVERSGWEREQQKQRRWHMNQSHRGKSKS